MRKKSKKRNLAKCLLLVLVAPLLWGCPGDARIASRNISRAADNFEVTRRIVFINGITDAYFLEIVGKCNIEDDGRKLAATCKAGNNLMKKHYIGLSDNVTYLVEQIDGLDVSVNHYRVVFRPQSIIPEIDLRGSFSDLVKDRH